MSKTIYWDTQDSSNIGPAYRTHSGESGGLEFTGWACLDGSEPDTEGYLLEYFFGDDGVYLGPDQHGVYPVFEEI